MYTRQTIEEELKELRKSAPIFCSLPKKNCFTVPEGYFNALPGIISEKQLAAVDTLTEGELAAIPKVNPFGVPANYFEELPGKVAEKIGRKIPEIQPTFVPVFSLRPAYAIAAVLIGILLIVSATVYVYRNYYSSDNVEFTEITQEEIMNSNILYEIDDDLILENISEPIEDDKDTKEAEDYLIQNNIDLSTLVNEL